MLRTAASRYFGVLLHQHGFMLMQLRFEDGPLYDETEWPFLYSLKNLFSSTLLITPSCSGNVMADSW